MTRPNKGSKASSGRGSSAPPTASDNAAVQPLNALSLTWLLLGVLASLFLLGRLEVYNFYLSADAGHYERMVSMWLDTHTLEGGDFPPGALSYFAFVRMLSRVLHISFTDGITLLDCTLIVLHLAYLNALGGRMSAFVGAALFLAAGPIVIYRYDLTVSFALLLAWLAYSRKQPTIAGFFLGIGVSIKLWPILILPVFAMAGNLRRDGLRVVGGAAAALVLVLLVFVSAGGRPAGILHTAQQHGSMPVSLDGVWGVTMQAFQDVGLVTLTNVGTRGFDIAPPVRTLASLVLLGSVVWGWWLAWKRRPFDADPMLAWLVGVIASIVIVDYLFTPQYLLWMAVPLALLHRAGIERGRCWQLTGLLCGSLFLQQYVYPLQFGPYLAAVVAHHIGPDPLLPATLYGAKIFLVAYYVFLQRTVYEYFKSRPAEQT